MLWARSCAHQFHGKRGDATARDFLHNVFRAERAQKADQDLVAAIERYVLLAGDVVGTVAENLHNNIAAANTAARFGAIFAPLSAYWESG